ncbi:hypothetical protein PR048_004985 [Dryococelus australis]|uniref:Uncharacterized protein n=1 Tax=Dryococelus australis TaxID=614101 RepID=A0ABQ9I820_9NEOP|nr:hypothetical protein PR048_004985 [Dryococelus australis]
MAGNEGGVHVILRSKYIRALFFHCSSNKLNLVVSNANQVQEIRYTIATIKDTMDFFRETTTQRNYAPKILKSAYQLHSVVTKPLFIVALITIAKYSAVLEPVVNTLQAKSMDLIVLGEHITGILDVLKKDSKDAD